MDFIELTDESGSGILVNINNICSVSEVRRINNGRIEVGNKAVLGMADGGAIVVNETLSDVLYGLAVCGATIVHTDGEEE